MEKFKLEVGKSWNCLDVSGFFFNTGDGFGYILDCFGCLEIHCNVSFKTMGLLFSNESHPTMTKSCRKLKKNKHS